MYKLIELNTIYYKTYNKVIQNFLYLTCFNENVDLDDFIDMYIPAYLRREQYRSCRNALEDLYRWTNDTINHELTSLHELILYQFIEFIRMKKKEIRNFNTNFFEEETREEIEKIIQTEMVRNTEITAKKLKSQFYDLRLYKKILFKNMDFLDIVKSVENKKISDSSDLSSKEQIIYYEILPLEIQEQIDNDTRNIESFINEFFCFVKEKIKNGNYSKLFWKNGKPLKESEIQIILYNLMEAYFYKRDISITREALVGRGRIDFTCYINRNESLLIEIKKASNTNLVAGYEEQTIQYMKSYQCQKAIYLIFCFNDNDISRASELNHHHRMFDIYHSYIQIMIIDVRVKNKAFINKSESMLCQKNSNTKDT